jgi:hypothetical protein
MTLPAFYMTIRARFRGAEWEAWSGGLNAMGDGEGMAVGGWGKGARHRARPDVYFRNSRLCGFGSILKT